MELTYLPGNPKCVKLLNCETIRVYGEPTFIFIIRYPSTTATSNVPIINRKRLVTSDKVNPDWNFLR